jgi:hypothetical protein
MCREISLTCVRSASAASRSLHHDHVGLPDDGPYLDRFRAVWTGSITAVGKAW